MEIPDYLIDGLRDIREGLHFRWNPTAVLVETGDFDVNGRPRKIEYEPRFEIWDTDPYGREYMVMRVQHPDGSFRMPDEKLIEQIWRLHPEKYDGKIEKLVQAQIDDPELLREIGTKKDSDDMIEAVANWAQWCETPKSGAALSFRGKRLLS